MSLWSRLMGRDNDEDQVEFTVGDDGTDHDIQDGDVVALDTGDVYTDDEDPDEYDESNSNGFDHQHFEDQGICGVCGFQLVQDDNGDWYCGCGYADEYDD